MKYFLTLLTYFIYLQNFSQNKDNSIYFPREYLILEACKNAENTSTCLYNTIQEKTKQIVKKYHEFDDFKEDTLKIRLSFDVTKRGKIADYKKVTFYGLNNNKPLRLKSKEIRKDLVSMINNLPQFEVVNTKPSKIPSFHFFYFQYVKPSKKDTLSLISQKRIYTGGEIEELPKADDCINKVRYVDVRKCNSEYLNERFRNDFIYKDFIDKLNLSGKLIVRFRLDTLGNITNVKTDGSQEDFINDEIERVLKRMPKFTPRKINGKKFPYTHSFRLSFLNVKK